MENQTEESVFDAKSGKVISVDSLEMLEENLGEEENIYELPVWTSKDGFNLLEEFVSSLRIKKVRDELQRVLTNGRGVFRNFKNVLKEYPEVEKRFHLFKNREMRSFIFQWYNSLREAWGLEKLSQDFEDYDELTQEDFVFRGYDSEKDRNCIASEAGEIADEIKAFYTGELGLAVSHMWSRQFESSFVEQSARIDGFICRTLTDEFAGCLLFSFCPSFAKETVTLTACFVNQNYRGLGIARELFSNCISRLKILGVHWFVIAQSVIPFYLEPLLYRCGFERKGSVYIADLTEKNI